MRTVCIVACAFAFLGSACASAAPQDAPAGFASTPSSERGKHARGDYDGDGQLDRVDFFESGDGILTILVRLATAPEAPINIWGGDIASFPYFEIITAPAGTYSTMCHLYGDGACGTTVPEQVILMHDGIFVHALEGPSVSLHYWDGDAFRDIIVED